MPRSFAKRTQLIAAPLTLVFALLFHCPAQCQTKSGVGTQTATSVSSTDRAINFETLRSTVFELANQKNSSLINAKDSKVNRLVDVTFNSPYNWHGSIGMAAKTDRAIYVIFPCRKIDAKDDRDEYLQRLLVENRNLGMMRFEIGSNEMVKLVLPLSNEDVTAEALNQAIQSLINTAKRTANTWANIKTEEQTDDVVSESGKNASRSNIPISGSAPPSSAPSAQANPGTVPTEGSSPSAGTTPHRDSGSLTPNDICKDGNMRMGTIVFESEYFGNIVCGPDGTFAGAISNDAGATFNRDKGTWTIVDGDLELTIGDGAKIRFQKESDAEGKLLLKTADGKGEIEFPN